MRTALQPGLISGVALWGTDGATVTLDSAMFAGIDDADQRLMVGQIVLTLDRPARTSTGSDFTLDGEPLAVFLRDNTLSEPGEAVGRSDYEVLLADPGTRRSSRAAQRPRAEPIVGEPHLRSLNGDRRGVPPRSRESPRQRRAHRGRARRR